MDAGLVAETAGDGSILYYDDAIGQALQNEVVIPHVAIAMYRNSCNKDFSFFTNLADFGKCHVLLG